MNSEELKNEVQRSSRLLRFVELPRRRWKATRRAVHHEAHGQGRPQRRSRDGQILGPLQKTNTKQQFITVY
jgi:hypothetical protein